MYALEAQKIRDLPVARLGGIDRVDLYDRPAVAVAQPRNRTTHAHRGRARQDGRNMVKVVAPIKPSR